MLFSRYSTFLPALSFVSLSACAASLDSPLGSLVQRQIHNADFRASHDEHAVASLSGQTTGGITQRAFPFDHVNSAPLSQNPASAFNGESSVLSTAKSNPLSATAVFGQQQAQPQVQTDTAKTATTVNPRFDVPDPSMMVNDFSPEVAKSDMKHHVASFKEFAQRSVTVDKFTADFPPTRGGGGGEADRVSKDELGFKFHPRRSSVHVPTTGSGHLAKDVLHHGRAETKDGATLNGKPYLEDISKFDAPHHAQISEQPIAQGDIASARLLHSKRSLGKQRQVVPS